jgi:hypothetical protein
MIKMKGGRNPLTLLLSVLFITFFAVPVFAQLGGSELMQYQEKELMAPDFTLVSLEGDSYTLSDYRGKKIVVVETGSST